ncbi:MAG: macrolide family glycosyltransferase [Candidatus Levyibacteriota bacterium]
MRFVFFSLPAQGHTNPTLGVAKELIDRGHTVIYYSRDEFRTQIESAGVIYRKYPTAIESDRRISKNPALFGKLIMDLTDDLTPPLLSELEKEKVDCIAYDTVALWGKTVSNTLHIPAVSFFTTLAFNNKIFQKNLSFYLASLTKALSTRHIFLQALYKYHKLGKRYGFKTNTINEFLLSKEKLNIVFTSSYFQPVSESFDKSFTFVGPSINARSENVDFVKILNTNKKIIYISTGTIFNDNLAFYRLCIETFKNTPYQVVMSLGHRFSLNDLPTIPDNMIIKNHIPQIDVLKRAAVFVTHAGMNSVNESMYFGVPMILIPQMYEQAFNAQRIQELGAGIYLKQEKVTKRILLDAIEKVLTDNTYHTSVKKIQNTLQETGGAKQAANAIEAYLSSKIR